MYVNTLLNFVCGKSPCIFPVFMNSEPVQINNKQSKGISRQVSYLIIIIIKTGQRSKTLDIATMNTKSVAFSSRPRFTQFVYW